MTTIKTRFFHEFLKACENARKNNKPYYVYKTNNGYVCEVIENDN